ncbi:Nif11-like leader peptide family natural product precursor [Synechococcus sp. MIT S9504]|uniref:Nif11-like leader peptide family natural product precursor n=1 Tax=Synechococcus sp. MIT S9504 TaxID=1801628 RepID=UPI0007BC84BD|nr:Nif11-like leader peptide family natural product precursor [Synechococcus sp. MIT S9504]KZR87176.1 hypothetical protein MITS9504_00592 [Synechococcus sp. MIT S9504]
MYLEQLIAILEKVKPDSCLQEKPIAANSPEDVIGIGKEHSHEYTANQCSQPMEAELEGVSGGGLYIPSIFCVLTNKFKNKWGP